MWVRNGTKIMKAARYDIVVAAATAAGHVVTSSGVFVFSGCVAVNFNCCVLVIVIGVCLVLVLELSHVAA